MTDNYKNLILKYLTNNLTEEEENNIPQFSEPMTIVTNINTFIFNNLEGTWATGGREFIQGKDATGNDLNLFILKGIESLNDNKYGFFVILDYEFNPIQIIKYFTSNVRIGEIGAIKIDNEGNFYMVEYSVENNKWRLVLLNNMLLKLPSQDNYFCKIRSSYNLPNSVQNLSQVDVFKSVTGSNYGLVCDIEPTPQQQTEYLIVNNLKIEVGMPNEWTEYSTTIENFSYLTGYWSWTNDDYIFQFFGYDTVNKLIKEYYLNNNNISSRQFDISSYMYVNGVIKADVTVLNENIFYLGLSTAEVVNITPGKQKYIIIKSTNNNFNTIYEKENATETTSTWDRIVFYQKNGIVFFRAYYPTASYFNLDIGLISNDNTYYFTLSNVSSSALSWYYLNKAFMVTIQFNLINYYIPQSGYNSVFFCQQIYNSNNYNGSTYENTNSLVPNSVIIFDDNIGDEKIIFARNLYNLNINGNTTISTIEIPNASLNNATMLNKTLVSQTNTQLAYDITELTKNIYENVYINFFNTLIMKNANTSNEILNYEGASRLNNSISQTIDYTNVQATKIKINYQDNTSSVQNITPATITNNVATYTFSIYVPKLIDNIEIISNDEATSYQTINGNFELNKYYTITQDVSVE